jgi:hypothetical protein
MPEGVRTMTAMGIVVGFGIDLCPGFITVNAELPHGWSVSMSDLMACALSNVHARAEQVDRSMIVHGGGDGIDIDWLQTNRHVGSSLVLAPSELGRIFGSEPRRFITPMRDLIIAFPQDFDLDEMRWYHDRDRWSGPELPRSGVVPVRGRSSPPPADGPEERSPLGSARLRQWRGVA